MRGQRPGTPPGPRQEARTRRALAALAALALGSCAPGQAPTARGPERDIDVTGALGRSLREGERADPALRDGMERLAGRMRDDGIAPSPGRAPAPSSAEPAGGPEPVREAARVGPSEIPVPQVPPPPAVAAEPAPVVVAGGGSPMECLPPDLRENLDAVARRFGRVDVVSTTELHTENHGRGRAKIHADCKAVDFRTPASPAEVIAFLRTRPGVGGVQSFRNGVVHLDDASAHPAQAYRRSGDGAAGAD